MPQSILDIILRTKKEGQGVSQTSKDLKELKKGLAGAIENFTGFSIGSIGVAAAIAGVGKVLKDSTDFAVSYAEQVRDLGRLSGTSAEETSRLIQVADDLKVEYGTLQQAAKALAKDGIALTTEELARASDEYLAIEDAGGRAEYAVQKFGKSGLEMTKILEQGGDALRKMAAEQNGNLILTEAQLTKARDYEKAQDELNDTMDGFKVVIGSAVIPVLTDLIKGITDVLGAQQKLDAAFKSTTEGAAKNATSFEDFKGKLKAAGYELDQYGNLLEIVGMQQGMVQYKNVMAAKDLEKEYLILKDIEAGYTDGGRDFIASQEGKAAATEAVNKAAAAEKTQLDLVTQSMNAFSVSAAYQKLATTMSADAYLSLGVQLGVVSNSAYTMNKMVSDLGQQLADGKITTEEYNTKLGELLKTYNSFQDKTVTIRLNYVEEGAGTNRRYGGEAYASGGSYVVPAGFNENYPVGIGKYASSGERVTITPAGGSGGGGGGGVTIQNVTIANGMDLEMFKQMLIRAMK